MTLSANNYLGSVPASNRATIKHIRLDDAYFKGRSQRTTGSCNQRPSSRTTGLGWRWKKCFRGRKTKHQRPKPIPHPHASSHMLKPGTFVRTGLTQRFYVRKRYTRRPKPIQCIFECCSESEICLHTQQTMTDLTRHEKWKMKRPRPRMTRCEQEIGYNNKNWAPKSSHPHSTSNITPSSASAIVVLSANFATLASLLQLL